MAARGRSRRTMSFSVDSVSIARGDGLPPAMQQPTPVFPVMEQKPLPLTGGEEAEYLLALKQDFRGAMRSLPCFIQPAAPHRDVERYSDKYHLSEQTDRLLGWSADWKRFPKELRVYVRKPARDGASISRSDKTLSSQKKKKKKKVKEKQEVIFKLEPVEKKEQSSEGEEEEEEEGEEKKKPEEEEVEEEEEYDEEEFEEETDYIMSYFDNGEDFGGDSDDNMDEAIY